MFSYSPSAKAALKMARTERYRHACNELPRPVPGARGHKAELEIEHPGGAVVCVTRSCIYGTDLHRCHGLVPDRRVGTTVSHEFTGVVEAVGPTVQILKTGDHVLVPFNTF